MKIDTEDYFLIVAAIYDNDILIAAGKNKMDCKTEVEWNWETFIRKNVQES